MTYIQSVCPMRKRLGRQLSGHQRLLCKHDDLSLNP